jgi:PAS domain S-box-containing protein
MPSYRAIFNNLPLPAVVFSLNGDVLDCNGSAHAGVLERRQGCLAAPRWLRRAVEAFVAGGAPKATEECSIRPGGTRPGRICLSLARVENGGEPAHVVAICKDVSQRTRNEEKIRRLAAIIDSSNDAMASVSLDGTILSANRSAAELYGYPREDLPGMSIFLTVPPGYEDELRQVLAAVRGGRDSIRLETMRRHSDGTAFPVSDSYSAILLDGIPYAVSMVSRDITGRRKIELDLKASHENLEAILSETVSALSMTLEKRDLYTAGHQHKVARIACAIGERLGLDDARLDAIHTAGVLHDIGKICIPMAILSKPTRLSRDEMGLVRGHPQTALDILKNIPFAQPVGTIIHQHHERMDGSGYPDGVMGDDICIGARILAVADVFEAMGAHRPYRPALGIEKAMDEFRAGKGTTYDSAICDALRDLVEHGRITTHNGEMILCQSR